MLKKKELLQHLNTRFVLFKGPELLEQAGGLHKFMNWDRNLLTVSHFIMMTHLYHLTPTVVNFTLLS